MVQDDAARTPRCVACGGTPEYLGLQDIRMGGRDGGWIALLGKISERGEWLWEVALFRCTSCGRIDVYDKDYPEAERAKKSRKR